MILISSRGSLGFVRSEQNSFVSNLAWHSAPPAPIGFVNGINP